MNQQTKKRVKGKHTASAKNANGRHDSKRSDLLDEAARVLNLRGVSQASLGQIAKNVGISRAALYYYVNDQQDLVYQCYARTCEELSNLLEASCNAGTTAPEIIDDFLVRSLTTKHAEFAALSDVAFLGDEQRTKVLDLYTTLRTSLADVITSGISQGHLRPCHPRIVASVILGLINWVPVAMRWPVENTNCLYDYTQVIRDALKYGIAQKRTDVGVFNKLDLSTFFTDLGNIFDPHARIAARRESLLLVASWLFNQKGIDATSLDEIASAVGVTKKVIYHNIGGKDELITACYRRAFKFFKFVSERASEHSGDRLDALCISLNTLASASVRKDIAPMVPITGHEAWSDDVREELRTSVGSLTVIGQVLYKEGMIEGTVREIDARSMVMIRPGYYEWMTRWGNSLSESELQLAPQELTKMYRLGLQPLVPE